LKKPRVKEMRIQSIFEEATNGPGIARKQVESRSLRKASRAVVGSRAIHSAFEPLPSRWRWTDPACLVKSSSKEGVILIEEFGSFHDKLQTPTLLPLWWTSQGCQLTPPSMLYKQKFKGKQSTQLLL